MPISDSQRRYLRSLAHALNPVVMVGQAGLSEAVLVEADQALTAHELIKVKLSAGDRTLRDEMVARLCERSRADLVQRIGHVAVLYRLNPKKKQSLVLPRG